MLGAGTTWNVSNVGAVAGELADVYGVSLAAIGLLTTALFLTHLAVQLPGGRVIDRIGARRVALGACAVVAAGNGVALAAPDLWPALAGRTLAGLGTGAGFVAGVELVRAGGGGPVLQGFYGGSTMAGAGLALMVVPQLVDPLGWRSPYWSGLALALGSLLPVLAAQTAAVTQREGRRAGVLGDRRLLPLGAIQAATFGLSVVAGNWVVTLLERQGHARGTAGLVGGLVLFAGMVTRPAGGLVVRRRPEQTRTMVAVALGAGAAGALVLAADTPLWLAALGSGVAGLAAGFPFAAVFDAAQRLRPDAPAAAVGLVNGYAVLLILVGTPAAGAAFELPGDGRIAFLAIGGLWAAALLAFRRASL